VLKTAAFRPERRRRRRIEHRDRESCCGAVCVVTAPCGLSDDRDEAVRWTVVRTRAAPRFATVTDTGSRDPPAKRARRHSLVKRNRATRPDVRLVENAW